MRCRFRSPFDLATDFQSGCRLQRNFFTASERSEMVRWCHCLHVAGLGDRLAGLGVRYLRRADLRGEHEGGDAGPVAGGDAGRQRGSLQQHRHGRPAGGRRPGRGGLWHGQRSYRPDHDNDPDHSGLFLVHLRDGLRADVVADCHLSLPRRAGHRRRMGRGQCDGRRSVPAAGGPGRWGSFTRPVFWAPAWQRWPGP